MPSILFREMTEADIPAGLELCRASHWNQTARDWQLFLTVAPRGALVAEDDGRVIGTVATLPYGPFTWISMVLVDPAARRRGIGTGLLERALSRIEPGVVARLDATPAGEAVYRTRGFVPELGVTRLFVDAHQTGSSPLAARPLTDDDWEVVLAMDRRAFGVLRAPVLERLAADAPEYAWVLVDRRGLRGFALGRHGHVRDHLGPVIADTLETALVLIRACRAAQGDSGIFIDVPDDQQAWHGRLAALGFRRERSFLRMSRGTLATAGDASLVYAIAGPELG